MYRYLEEMTSQEISIYVLDVGNGVSTTVNTALTTKF